MPFLLVIFVLLLPLLFVLLLPFSLVQRYRAGTARRLGHSWLARLNVALLGFSAWLFLVVAAATNFWVPRTLLSSAAGLVGGAILGLIGLRLTRWEPTAHGLHYTPNRPLVLLLTVAVAVRVIYGFWRGWNTWQHSGGPGSWLVSSGAAGSLAVGAVVLGYYLAYWTGVGRRLKRHGKLKVTRVR